MVLCNSAVSGWARYGLETCLYPGLLYLFITRFCTLMRADELSLQDSIELGAVAGLTRARLAAACTSFRKALASDTSPGSAGPGFRWWLEPIVLRTS
jgi:hypothetical protein